MDEMTKEIKKEKEYYENQYEKAYNELKMECNNLKELIENNDPLFIDFDAKIKEINDLKIVCNQLHYRIIKRKYKY